MLGPARGLDVRVQGAGFELATHTDAAGAFGPVALPAGYEACVRAATEAIGHPSYREPGVIAVVATVDAPLEASAPMQAGWPRTASGF